MRFGQPYGPSLALGLELLERPSVSVYASSSAARGVVHAFIKAPQLVRSQDCTLRPSDGRLRQRTPRQGWQMRCEAHQAFCRYCSRGIVDQRRQVGRGISRAAPRRRLRLAESHLIRGGRACAADAGLPGGAGGTSRAIVATTSKEAAKKSKLAAPATAQTGVHDRDLGPPVVRCRGARGRDVFPARAEGAERWRRRGARRRRVRRGAEVSEAAAACGRRGAEARCRRVALAPRRGYG